MNANISGDFLICISVLLSISPCVNRVLIWSYSGPYFPAFGMNTERYSESLRIHSKCGKIRTRITPNTDTFYAVSGGRETESFFTHFCNIPKNDVNISRGFLSKQSRLIKFRDLVFLLYTSWKLKNWNIFWVNRFAITAHAIDCYF